jgi:NitT/TauT family transport system substrate-binding protein
MGFFGPRGHAICALQMTCAVAGIAAATVNEAEAQTPIKFSLDLLEGPSAPFVVGIDRGYYQAEGLDVAIDTATGPLDLITRVASGTYEMGFADVNSLIRFRDQNPAAAPSRRYSWSTTARHSRS